MSCSFLSIFLQGIAEQASNKANQGFLVITESQESLAIIHYIKRIDQFH